MTRRRAPSVEKSPAPADPLAGRAGLVAVTILHAKPGQDMCVTLPSGGCTWIGRQDIQIARRVRFGACRSFEASVLMECGEYLVLALDGQPMPIVQPRKGCEEIPAAG